ncbi:ornithine decarboxylase antizyme-domain-containing protein [Coprinopsis sp. MPI-PUGE-AT-0042]|nr:ornithine decarboxylase antizyme-domain-containing protein [Coprinopsis sp. MPI-PUGE-AT-0042]
MSLSTMSNFINPQSSLCPANGRQAVGDGATSFDNGSDVLAVCHLQGMNDVYYYSTTFSGGPGVTKCPPDRGSSDCVRDSLASSAYAHHSLSSSFNTSKSPSFTNNNSPVAHKTPISSGPRSIPLPRGRIDPNLSTPPLTPDGGSDCSSSSSSSSGSECSTIPDEEDALDFLMTIFPQNGLKALPFAKRVAISAPNLGADFDGVVLELPGKPKTLYVDGKRAAAVSLRESIVALLDLADESLGCNALVIALERSSPNLGGLLHSLMYVGGTVVTAPPFKVDPAFVLVGLEI